jgi:uncharacterized YccA/Bax inhibitor family protein
MAMTVWTLVCSFLAVGVELVIGKYGLVVPVFASTAFCLITAQGGKRAFPTLALTGAILDLSYARHVPAQLLLLPLLIVTSEIWRKHGDCQHPAAQLLPGCIIGAVSSAILVLVVRLPGSTWGWDILWRNGWIILQGLFGGAILVPCLAPFLDGWGQRFGLPLYAKARNRGSD